MIYIKFYAYHEILTQLRDIFLYFDLEIPGRCLLFNIIFIQFIVFCFVFFFCENGCGGIITYEIIRSCIHDKIVVRNLLHFLRLAL